jgi:hypothetical protein
MFDLVNTMYNTEAMKGINTGRMFQVDSIKSSVRFEFYDIHCGTLIVGYSGKYTEDKILPSVDKTVYNFNKTELILSAVIEEDIDKLHTAVEYSCGIGSRYSSIQKSLEDSYNYEFPVNGNLCAHYLQFIRTSTFYTMNINRFENRYDFREEPEGTLKMVFSRLAIEKGEPCIGKTWEFEAKLAIISDISGHIEECVTIS